MKKVLIKIGATAIALVSLAACGGGSGSNATEIVVKHRSSQANHNLLVEFAEAYMKEHANTKITIEKYSGDYGKLRDDNYSKLKVGDEYPDITECYPDHVEKYFDFAGKVINVQPYFAELPQSERDDFVSQFIDENSAYSIEGVYSLPFSKSTETMYYSSELLGKDLTIGGKTVTIDKNYIESLTWESLFNELCPAIVQYNADNPHNKLYDDTDKNSCIIGIDSDDNLFITMCEQYGLGYTSVDKTTGKGSLLWYDPVNKGANQKKFIDMLHNAKEKKYLQTKGTLNDYVNTLFTANKCLFSIGSSAGFEYQIKDRTYGIEVANIPQAGAKIDESKTLKKAQISQGPAVCFFNHYDKSTGKVDEKRKELALDFYHSFVSTTNNTKWTTTTGYTAVKKSVWDTTSYQEAIKTEGKTNPGTDYARAITMKQATSSIDFLFWSPTFKGSSTSRDQVGGLVKAILKLEGEDYTDAAVEKLFLEAYNNTLNDMGD